MVTIVAQNPSTSHVCQPYKQFEQGSATYQLSQIKLPDNSTPLANAAIPSSSPTKSSDDSEDTYTDEGKSKGRYNNGMRVDMVVEGMRAVRMKLVKLGCWVNVDAELAVCQLTKMSCAKLIEEQVSAAGGLLTYVAKTQAGKGKAMDLGGIESMAL
jgi:hypothetical protein